MFDNVYKEGSIYIGIIVYVNCYFYILLVIKFLVNYILFVYEECCGYENIINQYKYMFKIYKMYFFIFYDKCFMFN